ncbi:hypothetical protein Q3V23_21705 [Streptomyces sp. VNUA116]|uniref:hypothetical protein n=1 Tax=Streptomyces sp. VNUA116 TaxID=3062449 RepID=UPI002676E141|nr:hypothetical protein [Streptomyces sp. VNUA116]WKU46459.1 hypothetical protein Q3V23_21705 [Streptomyces sp. VNUA116]
MGILTLTLAVLPTAAYAGGKDRNGVEGQANGSSNGQNVAAEVRVSGVQTTVNGGSGGGKTRSLTPSDSNWTPPACWYEPVISPKELKETIETLEKDKPIFGMGGFGQMFAGLYKLIYQTDKYDDYNMAKQGKGMFWGAVINPARKDDPEAMSCDRLPFWVDDNKTPDVPLAVSPKILAEYAYDELPIPSTDFSMSPDGKQTVNLSTWIWADKARFKPVSVTASLPHTNLSATTTATPVSLKLEPGTGEANLHPASGECPINADGSIGSPYSDAKKNDSPPCGLTYLRASTKSGTYPLKATITWKISWKSSTGEGGDLPTGTYGKTTAVTVQEIQAVNR